MANTPYSTTAPTGVGRFQVLGFSFDLANIAAGDLVVDYTIPYGFKLIDIKAIITKAASTAAKAATVTAKIDGTAVTGASVALTTATATLGAVITGTATDVLAGGNNLANPAGGSKLKLTASSVTAFVEGCAEFHITLQAMEA